jgi:hypothetical protein
MTPEAAIGLLRQEAGKGLDPTLVERFIEILPALKAQLDAPEVQVRKLSTIESRTNKAQPSVGLSPEPSQSSVFENIALAHREIYALYEIAQALGTSLGVADTMGLISSKLSNLVPFSCCTLFLCNEESDTLRCRYATGMDAEIIQQITVKSGHGLTGWVARNRRSLDRVSEHAAAVIYNSIVFQQTEEDSLTDPLTGLPNMRFMFLTRARNRFSRALRAPRQALRRHVRVRG